jgi:ABC-2 type transport system permease protein
VTVEPRPPAAAARGPRGPRGSRRWATSALVTLTRARIRETLREPGTMFWVFGFPILLSLGLGLAFRNRAPEVPAIGVLEAPGAAALVAVLRAAQLPAESLTPEVARVRLRAGKIALLVVPDAAVIGYRFDPTRAEARAARDTADHALQAAAGRIDRLAVRDQLVTEPGTRYIDFLVPGLIGMNVMSGSLWGIGWVIVNMRVRKLLKRLLAAPMRRRDFLLAQCLARLLSLPLEVGAIVFFARVAFQVTVTGSWVALAVTSVVGALSFASIAILVASRAQNTQTVSGLMNVVMMPMFVLSGVFFSSAHFPEAMQPVIALLPLTALNDALRAVMIDGASLAGIARPLAVLAVWGVACFSAGLRIFRWA